MKAQISTVLLILLPALSFAQVPVDNDGNVIGEYESQADIMPIGDDGIPRLTRSELQELVGPIALYPDDLLAIVLPASAYPLQLVEAARFLEALETDPTLEPDPEWDDSIVALINYPEVIELLNEDLDWTWRLGEAVVAQQADVVSAVESFRDVAYAAGNLKSDDYQTVSRDDGAIIISPTADDVIYVPYYEPTRVVHYQPRPVYYYHPRAYPVYYYPYDAGHHFDRGFFWGVTTAFTIGWMSDSLHVYHHSYRGHPYYGHSYWNDRWYRRPSINVYNTTYVNNTNVTVNRHSNGDRWHARSGRREYVRREGYAQDTTRSTRSNRSSRENTTVNRTRQYEPISFRERDPVDVSRARNSTSRNSVATDTHRQDAVENARENARNASRRSANGRADNTRQQATTRPPARSTLQPVRQETVARQENRREQQLADRSHNRTSEQRTRETREQAPARSQPTRTAPPRAERSRSEPSRSEPSRSEPTRSQPSRSQAPERRSQADRPERQSSEKRSRSRESQEH
jgi:hypothetical protein